MNLWVENLNTALRHTVTQNNEAALAMLIPFFSCENRSLARERHDLKNMVSENIWNLTRNHVSLHFKIHEKKSESIQNVILVFNCMCFQFSWMFCPQFHCFLYLWWNNPETVGLIVSRQYPQADNVLGSCHKHKQLLWSVCLNTLLQKKLKWSTTCSNCFFCPYFSGKESPLIIHESRL